mgnify:CR=1 FL=1
MNKITIALTAATAILAAPAVYARDKLSGEEKLAKLLEGREAGEPVDCISLHKSHDARIIDETAIVYGSGTTIYVNRPINADSLDDDEVMVTKLHTGRLCRLDTVRLHSRSGLFFSGFVGLEQFVPYRRVALAD